MRYRLVLLGLAAIAFGVVLVETSRFGVGISPDSVQYIRVAREIAEPGGVGRLVDSPVSVSQPPLFPLLLAGIEKATGADPFVSVRYLNALLFALSLYVTGVFFFGRADEPPHPAVAFAVPLFVLFSRSLHLVSAMAWTEPLFVLATLLFLASMSRYLAGGSPGFLFGAALLAIAAVYTRYSGVTLIAAGGLLIPFASSRPMRRRATDLVLFVGSTSAALGVWVARNLHVSGTLLGERLPAVHSFFENVALSLSVIQGEFLPGGAELPTASKIWIAAVVGVLALWMYVPLAGHFRRRVAEDRVVLLPCLVFSFVFYAFTIITSTTVSYDPIDFRLLAPIYVPALLAAASLLDDAMRYARFGEGRTRRIRIFTVSLIVAALIQPARQFAVDFGERFRNGSGLNSRVWIESELMGFLEGWSGFDPGTPIFSNAPMALAWHLGIDARGTPNRKPCASLVGERLRDCFLKAADPAFFDSYLLHFEEQKYPYHYSLGELAALVDLAPVAVVSDGGIYRVSRRGPED